MKSINDPYGIECIRVKEKAESERIRKFDLLMEQISELLESMAKETAVAE